ncbi:Transposase IS116/IS110/IS902 family [Legionella israelensis]|uniref:Transposase IS116/IS110/IS902 family protein n=1 Tax=Legionella israelensis TaxID=454 RepID=A0A0W0VEW2_9GAMM|nr:Transposase IS116/IS110/IS902 family protein [Legionella israelensis]SCY35911.1 Transposase IS116/IS110/IS902 family protein [Legionella israelensis DSM 19235]STX58694.1 Transposase IS116/IS110/IS902 family [Legionella israelensis]
MIATLGNAKYFKNRREVSAWLGLVPKQHSSWNKIRLGSISKRSDRYIRTLLIHGARTVINRCNNKTDKKVYGLQIKKSAVAITKQPSLWPIKMRV